ncbi:MAG TPA: hypothetical protein VGO11_15845 [Chthoniobacteraceae bacterium]|nr:hypothetical protein [Chthoniobacteraceae bacterium]
MNESHAGGAGCTLEEARAAKAEAHGVFARLAKVAGIGLTRVGSGYGLKVNLESAPAGDQAPPRRCAGCR